MALKDAMKMPDLRVCKFARDIENYTAEDLETLTDWIKIGLPLRRIVQALKVEYPEHWSSDNTVSGHLNATCSCPVDTLLKGVWSE